MAAHRLVVHCSGAVLLIIGGAMLPLPLQTANPSPTGAQITVLYDAFGKATPMRKDWGYAALIEYGGKRILFDTDNSPSILAQNVQTKHANLSKLDFVVISHIHGVHTSGS